MTRIFSKLIAVEVAAVAGAVELPRQLPNPAAINNAASLWDFSAAEEAAMPARVDCYGDSLLCEDVDGEIRCKFESGWPTTKQLHIPLNPTLAKPIWGNTLIINHVPRSGFGAPEANEDIAPPAHQMPSGHIRHVLKLILLY